MIKVLIFSFFLVLMFPNLLWAGCTSPAANEGEIEYFSAEKTFKYCNNQTWISMMATTVLVPTDVKVTTATHNGNFGDYQSMQTWIESNGCDGYIVCSGTDMQRYVAENGNVSSSLSGWLFDQSSISCRGWTVATGGWGGRYWWSDGTDNGIDQQACNSSDAVMCCKF